jgi:hypothetical protein
MSHDEERADGHRMQQQGKRGLRHWLGPFLFGLEFIIFCGH